MPLAWKASEVAGPVPLIDSSEVPPGVGEAASEASAFSCEAIASGGAVAPVTFVSRLEADPIAARSTNAPMTARVMFRDRCDGFFGGFRFRTVRAGGVAIGGVPWSVTTYLHPGRRRSVRQDGPQGP